MVDMPQNHARPIKNLIDLYKCFKGTLNFASYLMPTPV